MQNLDKIIDSLKSKDDVDCVFLTGSYGTTAKPYSDVDLVVVFIENKKNLKSVYTWIDGKFADVFFFDHVDIQRIESADELSGNGIDAVLVSWLTKASIRFDKSGKTSALKLKADVLGKKFHIPKEEQNSCYQKINYNLIANARYFESNDPEYLEALEIRLPYSFVELITGYFELRDIPWRGEKNALKYLQNNDIGFYAAFKSYVSASDLKDRFGSYVRMAQIVLPEGLHLWSKDGVIVQSKVGLPSANLSEFWKELIK